MLLFSPRTSTPPFTHFRVADPISSSELLVVDLTFVSGAIADEKQAGLLYSVLYSAKSIYTPTTTRLRLLQSYKLGQNRVGATLNHGYSQLIL
jgi:hypothetical protein